MLGAAFHAVVFKKKKSHVSDGHRRQLHVAALLLTSVWRSLSILCDKSALELVSGWYITFFQEVWQKALCLLGSKMDKVVHVDCCLSKEMFCKQHVWHIYPSVNSTLTLMLTETR